MLAGNAVTSGGPARIAEPDCVGCRLERDDVLSPQTPSIAGWLLIEHPGPWGPHRASENDLVDPRLRAVAARHRLAVQLIRRYGQRRSRLRHPADTITCFLVSMSGPAAPFLEELSLTSQDLITDAILDGLIAGRPSGIGRLWHEPLYLTCTHGRMDAACARLGRPVAHALTTVAPGQVWETTHVGGCRFAANVVCLPYGIYYGYVAPSDAAEIVAATSNGRIASPWYRGRASLSPSGQAADAFLRQTIDLPDLEAIRLVRTQHDRNGCHYVEFASDWASYTLLLCPRPAVRHSATCPPGHRRAAGGLQVVSMIETQHSR